MREIPILIGGGGERKTLRVAAQHADIWHGAGDVETLIHKHAVLDDWCTKVRRDPAEIERSASARNFVPEVHGTRLLEAGTTLFTVSTDGPSYDLDNVRRWIAWRDEQNARRPA